VPRPGLVKVGFIALNPLKLISVVDVVGRITEDVDQIVLQKTKSKEKLRVA